MGIAVEVQAAVHAEDRDVTVLRAFEGLAIGQCVFPALIQVQVVVGVDVGQRWLQEAITGFQRQTDSWCQVDSVTIGTCQTRNASVIPRAGDPVFIDKVAGAQVALKACKLGLVGKVQPAWMVWQLPVEGDLRQPVVRRDPGDRRQLVGLHVQPRRVVLGTVGERTLLVHVVAAFNANLVGFQILEVVRIADVGVVDFSHQARVKAAFVLPVDHPALVLVVGLQLAFVFLVVQPGAAELAFAGLGQVAELAFHQQAALGHVARVQRGIVVRRQVEVVRGDQREAAVAAGAERRWQEAGLATVVDREVDVRCIEHREILDPQGDVGRGAETGGRVQRDVVALELPGVAVRLTGGVGTVFQPDDGVFGALGIQGVTADVRLVHHVFGVVDLGFARVELNIGVIANHQRAVVANLHVAFEFTTVFSLVQVGFIGLDLHAALAHHHVTGELSDLLLLLIARNLGTNEGRCFVFRGAVVHAGAGWLDIGATTVRAGLGQLCRGQLVTGYPVKMAVIGATRFQYTAFAFSDEHRAFARLFSRFGSGCRGFVGRADGGAWVHRTWRQVGSSGLGLAVPTAGSRHLTVELFCGDHIRRRQRLHGQQAAGNQQREFFTKRGGFQCHLISPGFLRAISPRWGPHASRWSGKDAG